MSGERIRVGLVGLGRMGMAIAERLLEQGHVLTVWNRTPDKADHLVTRGARLAANPAMLAASADVILVIVRDDDALDAVYFDHDGLLAAPLGCSVVIDMTTATVAAIRRVGEAVRTRGGRFIDAPVSGTVTPARNGQLLFMAGGDPNDIASVRPLLDTLARKVVYAGPVGSGIAMKLVLNLPLATYWHALGEALALGRAHGLPLTLMVEQIADSKAAIGALASKLDVIQGRRASVEFDLAGLHKDMKAMQLSGLKAGVDLPGLGVAVQTATRAVTAGWGEHDLATLVRFIALAEYNGAEAA